MAVTGLLRIAFAVVVPLVAAGAAPSETGRSTAPSGTTRSTAPSETVRTTAPSETPRATAPSETARKIPTSRTARSTAPSHTPRKVPASETTRKVPLSVEKLRPATASVARIASWNVRRLGHGTKRMDLVARLLAGQDVAVLQEVMSPIAVHRLLAYLPGWSAVVSPRAVGRSGYAEHYAVLYRRDRVGVVRSFIVDDPVDRFAREPFVVCLRARSFDFCVLTIHVVFGRTVGPRNDEIAALGPLLDRLVRRSKERDWIVAGDFNRPARADCWSPLLRRGWTMTIAGRTPTSIGALGYRNDYDHLLLNPRHTREWTRHADRLDVVARLCGGDFAWCMKHVSDHAPIYATFSLRGPDDD